SLYLQAVQDVRMGGRIGGAQYQYTLQGADLAELTSWAPKLLRRLRTLPELRDVSSDQLNHGLQTQVVIDRDTASRLGVSPLIVDDTLYDALGQRQVSTNYLEMNQRHVVMEIPPEFRQDPGALRNIYVRSRDGQNVPLA